VLCFLHDHNNECFPHRLSQLSAKNVESRSFVSGLTELCPFLDVVFAIQDSRPSSWTLFCIVMASYFLIMSGFIYDVVNQPPSMGSSIDRRTGLSPDSRWCNRSMPCFFKRKTTLAMFLWEIFVSLLSAAHDNLRQHRPIQPASFPTRQGQRAVYN
jgi:hypothetical protein